MACQASWSLWGLLFPQCFGVALKGDPSLAPLKHGAIFLYYGFMARPPAVSHDLLNAALAGLEAQRSKLEEQIAQVRTFLGTQPKRRGRPPKQKQARGGGGDIPTPFKRRKMSAAARKKMAALMKKRWAAARKAGKTSIG
jgi:hypothetical protein